MPKYGNLKCECGGTIKVENDCYSCYQEDENGEMHYIVCSDGYCDKCNQYYVWDERYTFTGYENIEKGEE